MVQNELELDDLVLLCPNLLCGCQCRASPTFFSQSQKLAHVYTIDKQMRSIKRKNIATHLFYIATRPKASTSLKQEVKEDRLSPQNSMLVPSSSCYRVPPPSFRGTRTACPRGSESPLPCRRHSPSSESCSSSSPGSAPCDSPPSPRCKAA